MNLDLHPCKAGGLGGVSGCVPLKVRTKVPVQSLWSVGVLVLGTS